MNRQTALIAASVIVVCLFTLWWLLSSLSRRPSIVSVRTGGPSASATSPQTASVVPSPATPGDATVNATKDERAKTIDALIESGNVSITFFGKVVDQNSQPVGGAVVSYSYSSEHGNRQGVAWSASKVHRGETLSDESGFFSLGGFKGSTLTIDTIQKESYEYHPRGAMVYNYYGGTSAGKFIPHANEPVTFVMRANATAEPLVSNGGAFGKAIRLPANGTPVRWNVWQGKPDPNGELQVVLTREPVILEHIGQKADWSAKLQVIGGGIVEAQPDEPLYQAPEMGYTEVLDYPKLEQKKGVPARSFYIKTADGKYGRLQMELFPGDDGPTARCLIKISMNPSGSRNLE